VAHSLQSDESLVEQASRSDRRALAAIFKRYNQDLFRYCAALLGNSEDAADALQNTMVKVLAALPGERRSVHLKAWLYRIAHNESIELLRKRQTFEAIDPEALVGADGPEASAEVRERLRQLILDLRELPDRQRGALVMRELGGLSFEQIGSAFETSAAVARQTVYEARLGLREMERGRAMGCDEIRRKLSDGDRRVFRRRDVRAHLRHCEPCRDFEAAISARRANLAAISPISALAAAGLLKGAIGGAAASTGGVAAGPTGGALAGAGAGGAISTSAAVKAVATVALAGAIGVGAADRAGVVQVFDDGGGPAGFAPAGAAPPPGTPPLRRAANPEAGNGPTSPGSSAPRGATAIGSGSSLKAKGEPARQPSHDSHAVAVPSQRGGSASATEHRHSNAKDKPAGAGAANAHGANPNARHGNKERSAGHSQPAAHSQPASGDHSSNGNGHPPPEAAQRRAHKGVPPQPEVPFADEPTASSSLAQHPPAEAGQTKGHRAKAEN
jgi:RNA polymerase sigma factor (sigma-70 family)